MKTATYRITIDRKDIPIFEPIFERLKPRATIIEEIDDVFPELTAEDLEAIAIADEQIKLGLVTSHEEIQRRVLNRKGKKK